MKDLNIIKKTVSDYYGLDIDLIDSKSRKRDHANLRQVCHYFAKKYTKHSLSVIGKNIGRKNHSTVVYSDKLIKDSLSYDQGLIKDIRLINVNLRRNLGLIAYDVVEMFGYKKITYYSTGFLK